MIESSDSADYLKSVEKSSPSIPLQKGEDLILLLVHILLKNQIL
jgi:hypothetical protein